MNLLTTIVSENRRKIIPIFALGIVSGILSFGFLTFFNLIIREIVGGNYETINFSLVVAYILIIVGMIWSRMVMSEKVIKLSQHIFWNIRFDILRTVLGSEYKNFVKNKNKIHSSIMNDVDNLTEASLTIIEFTISGVVVVFCFIYLFVLSPSLFLVTLFTSIVGVFIYWLNAKRNNENLAKSRALENDFYQYLNSILDGYKEISLNPQIGNNILNRKIKPIAMTAFENNVRAFLGLLNNQITGQLMFYFLVVSILLVFSVLIKIEPMTIVNYTFVLLYLLGSIESIMVMLPGLIKSKVSLRNLLELKDKLSVDDKVKFVEKVKGEKEKFKSISLSNVKFSHQSDGNKSFSIGPITLSLEPGDVLFIFGGNGSGKTTFINTLVGLYMPSEGAISINHKQVYWNDIELYKSYFSVIFSDFHLFDEFYNLEQFDMEKANYYLRLFELDEKVEVGEIGFSTQRLSTGQRKRLALITALLEQKEVLVLDEWAADQDPYFRKKFYSEIIPELKRDGFTIVAITHDDGYYHCADKIYKMVFGELYNETSIYHQIE